MTIAVFILFFYQNYTSNINVNYISLQDSNLCQVVPVPTTTTLMFDKNGKWNTQEGFDITNTYYQIDYTNFLLETSFKQSMINTKNNFPNLGGNYNLAFLMLFALVYKTFTDSSKIQSIRTVGDISTLYSTNIYTTFTISSRYGICDLHPEIQTTANNDFILIHQYNQFINNSLCMQSTYVPQLLFDYNDGTAIPNPSISNLLYFKLSINTLLVSVSLNLNIIHFDIVSIVGENIKYLDYKGIR